MVTRWSPDTCDCVIEYDKGLKYVRTVAACKEPSHAAAAGTPDHLAMVLAHHMPFNDPGKYTSDKSDTLQPWDTDGRSEKQRDIQQQAAAAKSAERERIRRL
jgi:hypothetical protein